MSLRLLSTFILCAAFLSADTLVMRNGSTIKGTFVSGTGSTIRFAVGDRVQTFDAAKIDSIRFEDNVPSNDANGSHTYDTRSYDNRQPAPDNAQPGPQNGPPPPEYSAQAAPPPANDTNNNNSSPVDPPSGAVVPSGTQIVVRTIDDIDSEKARLGQTFHASLDQPVVVNGQVLLPRGADVTTSLTDSQQSGKFKGQTILTLDVKSIHANGRDYYVQTTGTAQASGGRGERTAKVVGGTAALGAIIGAIAGGGKGAAIGAGAGAATGAGVQAVTSGQHVRIPSETRLTFTLQRDLQL